MSERLTREQIEETRSELLAKFPEHKDRINSMADCALAQAEQTEAAPVAAGVEERDRDWILAMAAALGPDSGYKIPIAPNPEPFKALFSALLSSREGDARDAERFVAWFSNKVDVNHPAIRYAKGGMTIDEWRSAIDAALRDGGKR